MNIMTLQAHGKFKPKSHFYNMKPLTWGRQNTRVNILHIKLQQLLYEHNKHKIQNT